MKKAELKYKVIKSDKQYYEYCDILESMDKGKLTPAIEDEVELLLTLIEKWDDEHYPFEDLDPVEYLKVLMDSHRMKGYQLAKILKVSPGLVSDILNYKKGISKESIRILATYFKMSQEAFNRPYRLRIASSSTIGTSLRGKAR